MDMNFDKLTEIYLATRALKKQDWLAFTILNLLKKNTLSVGDAAAWCNVSHPYASAALTRLKSFGMVSCKRDGKHIRYSLENERTSRIISFCLFIAREKEVNEKSIMAAILRTNSILRAVCKDTKGDVRLRILELVHEKPGAGINDVFNSLKLSQQPIASVQVAELIEAGFLLSVKEGRHVRLTINTDFISMLEEGVTKL